MIAGYRYSNAATSYWNTYTVGVDNTHPVYLYGYSTYTESVPPTQPVKRVRHSYRLMWRWTMPRLLTWLSISYKSIYEIYWFPRAPPI